MFGWLKKPPTPPTEPVVEMTPEEMRQRANARFARGIAERLLEGDKSFSKGLVNESFATAIKKVLDEYDPNEEQKRHYGRLEAFYPYSFAGLVADPRYIAELKALVDRHTYTEDAEGVKRFLDGRPVVE